MRRILITVFLLFAVVTSCLGVWQIGRGFEKKRMHEDYLARQQLPSVELRQSLLEQSANANRRVRVQARRISDKRVYVDNVTQNGVPGYYVIEFAQLADGQTFAYGRGFVPVGQSRDFLPKLDSGSSTLEFDGLLSAYSNRVIDIGETRIEAMGGGKYRIQYMEQLALEEVLGGELPSLLVLKTAPRETGISYDWPSPKGISAHRSFSYAIQWFLMAFAAIVFLVLMRIQKINANGSEDERS